MSLKQTLEPGAAGAEQATGDVDVPRQPREFLTQTDICHRFRISDETWRRWRAAGKTPDPVDLPGRPRWRTVDIDAFAAQRVTDRLAPRTFFRSAVHRRRG